MQMPLRNSNPDRYSFGYQGQEKNGEVNGDGNVLDFKYRAHDPRIGRFWSVDPLSKTYPWNSPYAFAENRVIDGIDLEGKEWQPVNSSGQDIPANRPVTGVNTNIDDYVWRGYTETGVYIDKKVYYENDVPLVYSDQTLKNVFKWKMALPAKGTVGEAQINFFDNGVEYSLYFGTKYRKPITEHFVRAPWLRPAELSIGMREGNNPKIQAMIDNLSADFGKRPINSDNEPWCGVFVYDCLDKSGYPVTSNGWQTPALNTFYGSNWNEGTVINQPAYGAIAVMNYGHVAFVHAYNDKFVWILGGNQPENGSVTRDGVEVNINKYPRSLVSRFILPSGYKKPPLD